MLTGKIALTAMATVGSLAVWAVAQDPSFDFPAARHVGYEQQSKNAEQEPTTQGTLSSDDQRLTVSLKNASNSEVIDWLKNQGISFAIGDDQLDREGHISLNFSNATVDRVMRAIGRAWGGTWSKEDDVYIFRKGAPVFGGATMPAQSFAPTEMSPPVIAEGRSLKAAEKQLFGEARAAKGGNPPLMEFRTQGAPAMPSMMPPMAFGEMKEMTPAQKKQFEESMQKWSKEYEKSMEKWSKEMEKWSKESAKSLEGQKFMEGRAFELDAKALEEMHKSMEKMGTLPKLQKGQTWVQGKDLPMVPPMMIEQRDGKIFMNGKELPMKGDQIKIEHRDGKMFMNGKEIPMPKIEQKNGKMWIDGTEIPSPVIVHKDGKLFMDGKEMPMPKIEQKNGKMWMDGKELPMYRYEVKDGAVYRDGKKIAQGDAKAFTLETKDGKVYVNGKPAKALSGTKGNNFFAPSAPGRAFTFDGDGHFAPLTRGGKTSDFEGIYDSLTTMQSETLKRRGYLLYSDLTSKQRNMLGTMGGGSWSVSFSNNGKSITIKSDK